MRGSNSNSHLVLKLKWSMHLWPFMTPKIDYFAVTHGATNRPRDDAQSDKRQPPRHGIDLLWRVLLLSLVCLIAKVHDSTNVSIAYPMNTRSGACLKASKTIHMLVQQKFTPQITVEMKEEASKIHRQDINYNIIISIYRNRYINN